MSLRIRKTGEILCAAFTEPEPGDTYIDDRTHYFMSVMTGAIVASENHFEDHLWFWNIKDDCKEHYAEILEQREKFKAIGSIILSLKGTKQLRK